MTVMSPFHDPIVPNPTTAPALVMNQLLHTRPIPHQNPGHGTVIPLQPLHHLLDRLRPPLHSQNNAIPLSPSREGFGPSSYGSVYLYGVEDGFSSQEDSFHVGGVSSYAEPGAIGGGTQVEDGGFVVVEEEGAAGGRDELGNGARRRR